MSSRVTAAARDHLRSTRVKVWGALLVVVAGICAFVPLLNLLGYTFAFAMALVASLAGADLAAALVRRACATQPKRLDHAIGPGVLVAELFGRAALVNAALLVAPLLLLSANAIRVRNCDFWFGVEAYFGLTILSGLAGTVAGIAAGALAGRHRIWSNALPFLIVIAWWLHAVWKFYSQPPVFAYNAFGGFFPGNLYDENLDLTGTFYWARTFHVFVSVAVLGLVAVVLDAPSVSIRWLRNRRPVGLRARPTAVTAVAAAVSALLWFDSASLGFDIDADDVRSALGGRHETEHFVIYYPKGAEIEQDIELIAKDHEFRYAQALRAFEMAPGGDKISSYYFESGAQKKRLFGAERVHMAKPWAREIFLNHKAFPHRVLRHEIAHIVAGAFGDDTFGVSVDTVLGIPALFNVGMIEGAAVAADWPGHRSQLTPHQAVRAMRELGFEPPVERLFRTGFFQFSAARSYTTAGSFLYFMLTEYGAEKFRALYRSGGDFDATYGRSVGAFATEWRAVIDATELPPGTAEAVRERFRRRAVFDRPCPHAIARRRHEMVDLAAHGERKQAIDVSRRVCKDAPGEPRYKLELAQLYLLDRRPAEAREVYETIAADENWSTSIRAQALTSLADLDGRDSDIRAVLARLEAADAMPIDDETRRQIVARRFAAQHDGPAGPHLRDYFWRHPIDRSFGAAVGVARASSAATAEPRLGMPRYLVGLQLYNKGAYSDAVPHLLAALELEQVHPLITRKAAEVLAVAAYRAGEMDAVLVAAGILEQEAQPESVRFKGADWRERIHWDKTGKLLR